MAASTPADTALIEALRFAHVEGTAGLDAWLPILPVAIGLGAGALLMMMRLKTERHPLVALPALALIVLIDLALLVHVAGQGPLTVMMGSWKPPFGIAFTADLTGVSFALAAAVVGLACGIYGLEDISTSGRRYGFYPFLLVMMGGASGAFLTGDVFNLYVWFEVLLISSFGMLILGSEREQIDGALKYAVLNLIATTLFLITVGFLYGLFGTLNMADLAQKAASADAALPMMTLATLFALAFCMKAAAFPVNFWLPASYHTPKIVVSALFAALLTKVGVYSLIRVVVMLMPIQREGLSLTLGVVAAATMVLGALGALAQSDTRRLLGFVVISGIGYILSGIAIGAVQGLSAALFYALHSIVLMAALYLVIGQAGRLGGGFALQGLSGIFRLAPGFSLLSLSLFFAASGLPPFSGFWPKAMLVKAAIDIGAWWLVAALLVSGFLITLALARVFLLAYWRGAPEEGEAVPPTSPVIATARPSRHAVLPIALLAAFVFWFGLFPERLIALTQDAAATLIDPRAYIASVFPKGAAP
ncbi:Na+/H+ antiporter subunit D [Rhizobium paknamense]|uniref:Multicomponent Na+:H+ antiporter subunit D n=1 Tax=Rhizobium paknamense TaxID=1206817 RepID=A0ABU0I7X2_9HYPH|nr:Na+/H+ antiporter subunit D [Rhizobium paknamense]MDQ0454331.1 multicomponent Na+:H+ antiporter subunit D [Rhizobium paknamense]